MTGYRQLLAVPGMASLLGVSFLARAAITAAVMALTMDVVLGLHRSYASAGGVAAALTAGMAVGGPLLGRTVDRHGARGVLLATAAVQGAFWLSVPTLPYGALLAAAFPAGSAMVPAPLVTRQAIAAMTTARQRRPAFALESVQGELSYAVGPPIVILGAASVSPGAVAWGLGAALAVGGVVMALLDPPLRGAHEVVGAAVSRAADQAAGEAVNTAPSGRVERSRRWEWLDRRMGAVLLMAFGTTLLLSGTDLAIVARLREAGQVSWATLVVAVYGASSIVGGLIYGALSRPLATWPLLGLLGLATVPAGLAPGWPWLCLAGVVAGLLTAPTLSTAADAISRLAPPGVRGMATGLQSSALTAGFALGSSIVGAVIDTWAPAGGFVAAGLAGLLTALTGCLLARRAPASTRQPQPHPQTQPAHVSLSQAEALAPPDAEPPTLEPCGAGTGPRSVPAG